MKVSKVALKSKIKANNQETRFCLNVWATLARLFFFHVDSLRAVKNDNMTTEQLLRLRKPSRRGGKLQNKKIVPCVGILFRQTFVFVLLLILHVPRGRTFSLSTLNCLISSGLKGNTGSSNKTLFLHPLSLRCKSAH